MLRLIINFFKGIIKTSKNSNAMKEGNINNSKHVVPLEINRINIYGFDEEGEPEIIEYDNGSLAVLFNFMPPSNIEEGDSKFDELFGDFDKVLSQVTGTKVEWEDRELFTISNPNEDTKDILKTYLDTFWSDGIKRRYKLNEDKFLLKEFNSLIKNSLFEFVKRKNLAIKKTTQGYFIYLEDNVLVISFRAVQDLQYVTVYDSSSSICNIEVRKYLQKCNIQSYFDSKIIAETITHFSAKTFNSQDFTSYGLTNDEKTKNLISSYIQELENDILPWSTKYNSLQKISEIITSGTENEHKYLTQNIYSKIIILFLTKNPKRLHHTKVIINNIKEKSKSYSLELLINALHNDNILSDDELNILNSEFDLELY